MQIEKQPSIRDLILGSARDAAHSLLYYDRKNDEELSVEDIEQALADYTVTIDEIVDEFRAGLEDNLI